MSRCWRRQIPPSWESEGSELKIFRRLGGDLVQHPLVCTGTVTSGSDHRGGGDYASSLTETGCNCSGGREFIFRENDDCKQGRAARNVSVR